MEKTQTWIAALRVASQFAAVSESAADHLIWTHVHQLVSDLRADRDLQHAVSETLLTSREWRLLAWGLQWSGAGDDKAIVYYERALAGADLSPEERVDGERGLGSAYFAQGKCDPARVRLRRALELIEGAQASSETKWRKARILRELGWVERFLGYIQRALDMFTEAAALEQEWQQLHPEYSDYDTYLGIALCMMYKGDYPSALDHCEREIEKMLARSDEPAVAYLLYSRGLIQILSGDLESGIEDCKRSSELGRSWNLTDCINEASWIMSLGYLYSGDLDQAAHAIQAGLDNKAELTAQWVLAIAGVVQLRRGMKDEARSHFEQCVAECTAKLSGEPNTYDLLDSLGIAYSGLALCGDQDAESRACEAFARARAITCERGIMDLIQGLFRALDTVGKLSTARDMLEASTS